MCFGCTLRDLFFAFGDGVIDRAARCVEAEVNDWVTHAWHTAYHWGLPMEPEMKRRLPDELSELRYAPRHEIGRVVSIRDQVHFRPEDNRNLRETAFRSGGRELLSVVFSDRRKVIWGVPEINPSPSALAITVVSQTPTSTPPPTITAPPITPAIISSVVATPAVIFPVMAAAPAP